MSKQPALIPIPKRILVITLRHLGDVLLTTPMLHSLRQAYPSSQLDILVFSNTAGMLEGNPDIDHIISIPHRHNLTEKFRLYLRLCRHYELAVITQTGDRPFFLALISAPIRVAVVPRKDQTGWWKRYLIQYWSEFDDWDTHTVLQLLKLTDLIGVPRKARMIPPTAKDSIPPFPELVNKAYVVIHCYPLRSYKRWTMDGWVEICRYIHKLGFLPVLSGGPDAEESEYIAAIQQRISGDSCNLAGRTSLAQLADIITQAVLYIGPDTGTTHLAAATGTPVIALYGPTNPVKWAPWPSNYNKRVNPFHRIGSQQVNNIYFIQGEAECVPCDQEGCERHRLSYSRCLDTLTATRIKQTIKKILQPKAA